MFLKKARKSYKGKVYETYALTESYRENGKVKHRNICNLGALTDEQASRIRLVLQAQQAHDVYVGPLVDVVAKQHFRFLDVAVLDQVWRQFDLHVFFESSPLVEAMALNRCLQPKSKIQIQQWTQKTVLPRLLKHAFDTDNEYGIYRVLDQITDREAELQLHLYRKFKQMGHTLEQAVFYDITSSYFEGGKCILAAYGYSRDHRPDRLQVNIGLVITPQGYPLYWRVMPGNTTDITTIEDILGDLRQRFGLTECLLVFDRGMVSEDNLQAIASEHLTYVSAMDKDEIPKLQLLPSGFQERVVSLDWKSHLLEDGFQAYDEQLVYREHVRQSRRYILAFDRRLHEDQQRHRQQLVQKAKDFVHRLNTELEQAQKSRDPDKLTRKIQSNLRKWNLHKVFAWRLIPLALTVRTKKGKERTVNSFEVTYTIQEEILKQQAAMDGITCFVTNQPPEKLTAAETIQYYRRKNKIEEAFQEMKQFLHLRPFYVTREKRVRAHVSICVLGYLLLNAIEQQLRQHGESLNVIHALEQLGDCLLNRIGPKDSGRFTESITEVTSEQKRLLEKLGCEHVVTKKFIHQLLEQPSM